MNDMQKRSVTPQAISEFISGSPHFRNAAAALLKIAELKTDASSNVKGMRVVPNDILMSVPADFTAEEVESRALRALRPKEALQAVARKMGFGAIRVDARSSYDFDNDILALSPEGALAVSLFSKLRLSKGAGKEIVLGIMQEGAALPSDASPRAIAESVFFIHVAATGLDGAFANLYLGDGLVEKLVAGGRASDATKIRDHLYGVQLEFLKKLF